MPASYKLITNKPKINILVPSFDTFGCLFTFLVEDDDHIPVFFPPFPNHPTITCYFALLYQQTGFRPLQAMLFTSVYLFPASSSTH